MIRSSAAGSARTTSGGIDLDVAPAPGARRSPSSTISSTRSRSGSSLRGDVDRLRVEAGEVEQLLDEAAHALALLRERVDERVVLLRGELPARARSVSAEPEIVVTGVRSSCAASATKFVISRFARSSVTRASRSCGEEPCAVEREKRELADRAGAGEVVRRRRTACTASSRCSSSPGGQRDARAPRAPVAVCGSPKGAEARPVARRAG